MKQDHLYEILACPKCHGHLDHDHEQQLLICQHDQLAYPIVSGIPVLLVDQAQPLN